MSQDSLRLIERPDVIQWCFGGVTSVSLRNTDRAVELLAPKIMETEWGNDVMKTTNRKQWTTVLCQSIVMEALVKLGRKNVRRPKSQVGVLGTKKYDPDLECDDFIYEVKGRSWCTPGTAGEKVLGVPLKYGELPQVYNKPLQIILVGYQEYEARKKFAFGDLLDRNNQTRQLQESLAFFEQRGIQYIAFTDILKKLGITANDKYNYLSSK